MLGVVPLSATADGERDDEHRALQRTAPLGSLRSWDWQKRAWVPVVADDRDLKAPVLVVHLWATWCGPCLEEFHSVLAAIAANEKKWPDTRFLIVMETDEVGPEAQQQAMREYLDKLCARPDTRALCRARPALPGRWLLDTGESIKKALEQDKLPLTILLDSRRVVRDAYVGSLLGRLGHLLDSIKRLRQLESGTK